MRRDVLFAIAAVALLSFLVALPLDMDDDGLMTWQEWGLSTDALDADSDDDGVEDGAEIRRGLSPTRADSDEDGLLDGQELALGLDALVKDMDGDGVLDGMERALACVRLVDCDGDGLADGRETGAYDPLDPDSFDLGLSDGLVRTYEDAGQAAGPDADLDGIPDAWEVSEGIISWGELDPMPGQTDLLVEFLHVTGPSSGRFELDFSPAYRAVESLFSERGIRLQWKETMVHLPAEHRPGFLDDSGGHYRAVLDAGTYSQNPYVTSIVLNPQQVQEDLAGDILGAAFLRSMIATLDYGAHVELTFQSGSGDGLSYAGDGLVMRPVVESHIIGARPAQVRQLAAQSEIKDLGVTVDGRVYYVVASENGDLTWAWQPDWFVTSPRVTTADGAWYQFGQASARVDHATLAATIAHELGHTLGLCHAHEPACFDAFGLEAALRDRSTMSYNAPAGALHFLDVEWQQIAEYVTCPPEAPIRLLAEGADADALYQAKYEISFTQISSLRACGDVAPVEGDLEPATTVVQGARGGGWLSAYVVVTLAAAAIAVKRL